MTGLVGENDVANTFKKLVVNDWQQFSRVSIDFHPRLTVITGANGSGKTTLLRFLAQHADWGNNRLAVPKREKATDPVVFYPGREPPKDRAKIGDLEYGTGKVASLELASPMQTPILPGNRVAYAVQLNGMEAVKSIFLPSHRLTFNYQQLTNLPLARKTEAEAFSEVNEAVRSAEGTGPGRQSPSFPMKATLTAWAYRGYNLMDGDRTISQGDPESRRSIEGFKGVLKELLPKGLRFEDLVPLENEIVFRCAGGHGDFLLESASGGIANLIDLAWRLYFFSKSVGEPFTVMIDEAENHLHPAMQRSLLPDLLRAFPQATFIVTTHSPLIVGSVRDSFVHVLRYDNEGKVISEKLDLEGKARNATEILDDVLGLSSTLPLWAEGELEKIVRESIGTGLSAESFKTLHERLRSVGLDHLVPEAIDRALEQR